MDSKPEQLPPTDTIGLREAERRYGVDHQLIRYWIKRGYVRVAQQPSGPGQQLLVDHESLRQALANYRPRKAQADSPAPAAAVAGGKPPQAPPRAPLRSGGPGGPFRWAGSWLRVAVASGMIGLALAMVILPLQPGLAATVTLSQVKQPATGQTMAKYALGEVVVFNGEVQIVGIQDENVFTVQLDVQGPQPLTVNLPIQAGMNQTVALPSGFTDTPQPAGLPASLKVDVVHETVGFGAGYGYGYFGQASNSKIKYTLRYTPPIMKSPAPLPPSGPPSNPSFAFDISGDGLAGGGGDIAATLLYDAPGSPYSAPGAAILGLASNPMNTSELYLLVDGGGGNDAVLTVDRDGGFLLDAISTNLNDLQGVAGLKGDIFVLREGPTRKIVRVLDADPANDTAAEINVPGNLPIRGLAAVPVPGSAELRTSEFTSNAASTITIKRFSLSGNFLGDINVPSGPTGGGYNGLAYAGTENLGVHGNKLARFDMAGFVIQVHSITPSTLNVQGLEYVTGAPNKIYLSSGGSVYSATAPSGGSGGPASNPPLDIAASDDKLFILVDASPDRILVKDKSGNNAGSDITLSGLNQVESLAVFENHLWFVDNSGFQKVLHKRTLAGAAVTSFNLPTFVGNIGDLATKGTQLVLAEQNNNTFHLVSSTGGLQATFSSAPGGFGPAGNDGLAFQSTTGQQQLWGSKFVALTRFNATTGAVLGTDYIPAGQPPFDISGLAQDGQVLWMTDKGTNKVFKATFPGEAATEVTTIGDYSAFLKANTTGGNFQNLASRFNLQKQDALVLAITSPTNNSGVSSSTITVQGTVNDPTVKQVSFGAVLDKSVLFGNPGKDGPSTMAAGADQAQYATQGLWRFANGLTNFGNSGNISGLVAHYGKDSVPSGYDFNTGSANTGNLDTASFVVGAGSKMTFKTKYETEPGIFYDKKLIQFCQTSSPATPSSPTCNTLGQITDFGFNVPAGTVTPFPQAPGSPAHSNIFVPGFTPNLVQVNLSLGSANNGKTGFIRFKFDSVDMAMNDFDGWVIDDVQVEGQGGDQGQTITVGDNSACPTITLPSGGWCKPFSITEGENVITVSGQRNAYAPALNVSATVTVFLDNTAPIVVMAAVTSPTNSGLQTVSGTYTELNPKQLEILVGPAGSEKLVFTEKDTFTGTFSQQISLAAGSNKVIVRLTDKSSQVGTDDDTIILDQTGPILTVLTTIYPVGQVSARSAATGATDEVVIPVTVTDTPAGVQKVIYQRTGTTDSTAPQLLAANSVPQAVKDMWEVPTGATHLLVTNVPANLSPSTIALGIKAFDLAGNTTTSSASVKIVATLEQFNLYLMPGFNFIGAPLPCVDTATTLNQCNSADNSFNIANLLEASVPNSALSGSPKLKDVIETISGYDGGTSSANFKVYTTDASADSLDRLQVLRGYIVKTKTSAFKTSTITDVGTVPAPIKMTLKVGIKAGELPPSQAVVIGYNLVSPLTERATLAERFLSGVANPTKVWVSLLVFENSLTYLSSSNTVSPVLGQFKGKFEGDKVDPGKAEWLFLNANGTLTPTLE